jgi:hypothetical protein
MSVDAREIETLKRRIADLERQAGRFPVRLGAQKPSGRIQATAGTGLTAGMVCSLIRDSSQITAFPASHTRDSAVASVGRYYGVGIVESIVSGVATVCCEGEEASIPGASLLPGQWYRPPAPFPYNVSAVTDLDGEPGDLVAAGASTNYAVGVATSATTLLVAPRYPQFPAYTDSGRTDTSGRVEARTYVSDVESYQSYLFGSADTTVFSDYAFISLEGSMVCKTNAPASLSGTYHTKWLSLSGSPPYPTQWAWTHATGLRVAKDTATVGTQELNPRKVAAWHDLLDYSESGSVWTLTVGARVIATSYRVGANQVVGDRLTGWGAPTGTATRSAFATGTVTTAQLAERVKALIEDLTSHGLIGP